MTPAAAGVQVVLALFCLAGSAPLALGAMPSRPAQEPGPLWPVEAREAFFRCAELVAEGERLACFDGLAIEWNLSREQLTLGDWETETVVSVADGSWSLRAIIRSWDEKTASGAHSPDRLVWTCEGGVRSVRIEPGSSSSEARSMEWHVDGKEARSFAFDREDGRLAVADPSALLGYVSGASVLRVVIEQMDGGTHEASFRLAPGVNALIDAMRKCGAKLKAKTGGLREIVDAEFFNPPVVVHRVEPDYPSLAKMTHTGGAVMLLCRIKVDGSVVVKRLLNEPLFGRSMAEAAAVAASKWRYEPATLDGAPIETDFVLTVTFTFH